MPTSKICTDTVTLYNYIGEINFVAAYSTTILCNVNVHMARSTTPPGNHSNKATLCIFDQNLVAVSPDGVPKTFMPNDEWNRLDADEKRLYWTLDSRHAGKDVFVLGRHDDAIIPNVDRFQVESAERFNRGTMRVRHWRVVGA